MGLRNGVTSVVAFLRAGYPTHAPALGYAPVLALLPRRLCSDEAAVIASTLIGRQRLPIDNADVGVEITRITAQMPSCEDIDRVQRRLDAMGRAGG
ncbi:DUF3349 domain-containing protein [Mycobacterium terramassiliense]|uniref:DUF3349 domain-containing protein n=1 Tax=Mycobacterium terramassiliense TaxID=1841859 RepID=A0A2U3NA08_9MYCO|nr:DUF3349 domain-containing protein [Mycobacterium terramassiliense]SPM28345.1 hypothetical protein MTAB308_1831 [Mycobacterium terramassiliense]